MIRLKPARSIKRTDAFSAPQRVAQCRQGCRIDIGGRSQPRRPTGGPVEHPSRNLHRAAGVRTAQRAAEHNLVRLADRLMNGDAMRKPRMPGVQELTEYRSSGRYLNAVVQPRFITPISLCH